MKRYVLLIVIFVLCLAMMGGTYAYTAVSSKAHNIITSGAVKIAVEEWQQTEEGMVPYPKEPVAVMPGHSVSKIVTVRNLDKACYVRARIEASVFDAQGNEVFMPQNEMAELFQADINKSYWKKKGQDDGWWYYYRILSEAAVTEPLFESVLFAGKEMGNDYQGCSIQIHVSAQAVQFDNNAASALSAVGWPEKQE